MKYRSLIFSFALFLIAFASAAAQTPVVGIEGRFAESSVSRGSKAKGSIVLTIPEGLHVNSNKPNSEYAIPTSVRITGVGLKPGAIEYPAGTDRKFQFSESELNVYEGEVVFSFSIAIPKNFRGKAVSLRAVVRYQACTEELCYPPKNSEVTMTAAIVR